MRGRFTSTRFPYLPLRIEVRGHAYEVEALLDTGFDGHVALPAHMLPSAEASEGHVTAELADGSAVQLAYYRRAVVTVAEFASFSGTVVAMGDEPLAGRGLSDRFRVTLNYGRQLTVEQ